MGILVTKSIENKNLSTYTITTDNIPITSHAVRLSLSADAVRLAHTILLRAQLTNVGNGVEAATMLETECSILGLTS